METKYSVSQAELFEWYSLILMIIRSSSMSNLQNESSKRD